MAKTRTGQFPIGFRRGAGPWQQDLPALLHFACQNAFESLDVGALDTADLRRILAAGLAIGSVDLCGRWSALASADPARRRDAAQSNAHHIRAAAALGVRRFFAVVAAEDPLRPRQESFHLAVDGFAQLCHAIADLPDVRIVIEGWPGPAPHYPSLVCTPETYRAFFAAVASPLLGINFDPSHLIRMGICPHRFLDEFASRVHHVHAKDTALLDDALYNFGHLQPATFAAPHAFGGFHWRYTIPGRGAADWPRLLAQLHAAHYRGYISIELEDEQFHGCPETEQRGLLQARAFLETA